MYHFQYQSVDIEFRVRFTVLKIWYDRGEFSLFENEKRNLTNRLRNPNLLLESTREVYRRRLDAMNRLYRCRQEKHWRQLKEDLPSFGLPKQERTWMEKHIQASGPPSDEDAG
jgi:hypothetical protein